MVGSVRCRLSVVYPEITEMQVKAIISAAADAIEKGIDARPEIMIPLVINVPEARLVSDIAEQAIKEIMSKRTVSVPYKIGTMMETPRA
ncbi:MAG: pyruvate,orthophosphate dikinase [Candidatus Azotimanducaceae bacterium]|jgi:pyruvate,orthophosphate dikinase